MITPEQFKELFPAAVGGPEPWVDAINAICPGFGIDTPIRLAQFLAQVGHESQGFNRLIENLNYSATGLLQLWPKRFTPESAQQFARHPEAIANHVYANRNGNGDEASGDGWKFRGHGPLQTTGRANLQAFANHVGLGIDAALSYILTPKGGITAACLFWQQNNLNAIADAGRFEVCTRIINGGYNGLADRRALYAKAVDALEVANA